MLFNVATTTVIRRFVDDEGVRQTGAPPTSQVVSNSLQRELDRREDDFEEQLARRRQSPPQTERSVGSFDAPPIAAGHIYSIPPADRQPDRQRDDHREERVPDSPRCFAALARALLLL